MHSILKNLKLRFIFLSLIAIISCDFKSEYIIPTIKYDDDILPEASVFDELKLIEEIDCSQENDFYFTNGTTEIQTILGEKSRVLKPDEKGTFFYYRLGTKGNLEAGKAYFLEVEYPDDRGRSFIVQNRGGEYSRGIHTGNTLGDCYKPPYVKSNAESISLPHTNKYQRWRTLFWLHDNYAGLELPRDGGNRLETPEDGFLVIICQFSQEGSPLNNGAAVSKIRLYEAPAYEKMKLAINFPPDNLPRRHLFFREEMSDAVVNHKTPAIKKPIDWYEHKIQLMKFLGMNTFSKDLLEFGHNQGWDSEDPNWINLPVNKNLWDEILEMITFYKDIDIIPYFEYNGGIGPNTVGMKKRAHPLNDNSTNNDYTQIWWSEKANADFTDPEIVSDFKKVLDKTIIKYKDQNDFSGIWLRPRVSHMPVSFSDNALKKFSQETENKDITRNKIRKNDNLYEEYLNWWNDKRKEFLITIRDYLEEKEIDNPMVLFTADFTETGKTHQKWANENNILTDNEDAFKSPFKYYPTYNLEEYILRDWHLESQLLPAKTWGQWEWQHSVPPPDPDNYRDEYGINMTYTFNKTYTVGSESAFDAFKTKSGLAIIRHYALNEDGIKGLGYFVVDIDKHGPFIMLAEARAMAYGDPYYIGYLASAAFNRADTEYVRDFNANYLSLPALPSQRLINATSDSEIIVREINTKENGKYFSIINTSLYPKNNITITLPNEGKLSEAATGKLINKKTNKITVNMWPAQLKSYHLK